MFPLGFGLNQNTRWLCGRSLVRSADKQNVQFQPLRRKHRVTRESFFTASPFETLFSLQDDTTHTTTHALWYLYPSLEFDPTTTGAEQAVIIVISTC